MSAMSRIWPWRSPAVRDWTVALALLGLGLADIALHPHSKEFPDPLWANYAFLVAGSLPLGFRRKAPATVAVLVIGSFTVWSITMYQPSQQSSFEAFLGMLAAFYILGADLVGRRQLVVTLAVAACTIPSWLLSLGYGNSPGDTIPALVFIGLAWTVGYVMRRRPIAVASRSCAASAASGEQCDGDRHDDREPLHRFAYGARSA